MGDCGGRERWSFALDHHSDADRQIGLFSTLIDLRLDGSVEFSQLLPQTFRVGNNGGQTVRDFPITCVFSWRGCRSR